MSDFRSTMAKLKRSGGLLAVALLAALVLLMQENHSAATTSSLSIENRLQSVLSQVEGAGEVSVLVNADEDGAIVGVCVLTTNANDVATVFRLQRAVQTALGIDNDRVEILSMEEKTQ